MSHSLYNTTNMQQIRKIRRVLYENPEKAISLIKKLNKAELTPEEAHEVYLLEGDGYLYLRKYETSLGWYKKALSLNAKNKIEADCYLRIGSTYYEKGDYAKAIKNLNMALSCKPVKELERKIYNWLCLCYKDKKEYNAAIDCYKRLTGILDVSQSQEEKEDFEYAICSLATCYWKIGDVEKADEYFMKIFSMSNPTSSVLTTAYGMMGHRFYEKKEWVKAEKYYKKAVHSANSKENKSYWQKYLSKISDVLDNSNNKNFRRVG